jgi:predicted transcriptional regulator
VAYSQQTKRRRMLETLPDDASWEDVQYSIFVRERIERGRREAAEGKLSDQNEVELRMKEWLET